MSIPGGPQYRYDGMCYGISKSKCLFLEAPDIILTMLAYGINKFNGFNAIKVYFRCSYGSPVMPAVSVGDSCCPSCREGCQGRSSSLIHMGGDGGGGLGG